MAAVIVPKSGPAKYPTDLEDADNALNLVNRKILEIKKKIQLSEGQRKAHFEEADAAKRIVKERTARLKREIEELKAKLKASNRGGAEDVMASRMQGSATFKPEIPLKDKSCEDALEAADLKETELRKRLDLARDIRRKRRQHMGALARKFRDAVALQADNMGEERTADRSKSTVASLENRIHRARVLWFESEHVRRKYHRIRAALLADSAKHDVRLNDATKMEAKQRKEIEKLQAAHAEAVRMRNRARALLQRRERSATEAAAARAQKINDLRRQVEERQAELERLERRIFPVAGSRTLVHQDSETDLQNSTQQQTLQDSGSKKEEEIMEDLFQTLKAATGAATTDEVLAKFQSQRESLARLLCLRHNSEQEKKRLEKRREQQLGKLEAFKCDDVKSQEVSEEELEKTSVLIGQLDEAYDQKMADFRRTMDVIRVIRTALHTLSDRLGPVTDVSVQDELLVIPEVVPEPGEEDDGSSLLNGLEQLLRVFRARLMAVHEQSEVCTEPESDSDAAADDKSVEQPPEPKITGPPRTYSELVENTKKPPVRSSSHEKAIAGTDDEEEAPSRGFLKRQAQLIVDAKSRRKSFRAPRK